MIRKLPRLLYVVTHGLTARYLLRGQLRWMRRAGFEVAMACPPGPDTQVAMPCDDVRYFEVPMNRDMSPLADLRSMARLAAVMRVWRPDVVNASTPKAGLLGMLVAKATAVPIRVYTLRGLRLESARGLRRHVLLAAERTAAACATDILAVSHSLADRYAASGLCPPKQVRVLGQGGSNGVELTRFNAAAVGDVARLRSELGIPEGAPVIGFVGRFTRDKGLSELVSAFPLVREQFPDARLLLVGDFEAGDPVPHDVVEEIASSSDIVRVGFVSDTAPYYHLMDVLAFPSYREGFPNAPLEAAAVGLPVAGFRATGTVDAVLHGQTGTLVEIGDVDGLAAALLQYLTDPALASAHGRAGQERVRRQFSNERVWTDLENEYHRLLASLPPAARRREIAQDPGASGLQT